MNRRNSTLFILVVLLLTKSPVVKAQSSSNVLEESYVNEELVFSMYDDLKRFVKSDIPFTKEVEAIINSHNSNQIDTCATYFYMSSKIVLYELKRKIFPSESLIKDRELTFQNGIKVGLYRSEFNKIVSLQTRSELIELTDLEYNTIFNFEFRNDTLATIRFSGYHD